MTENSIPVTSENLALYNTMLLPKNDIVKGELTPSKVNEATLHDLVHGKLAFLAFNFKWGDEESFKKASNYFPVKDNVTAESAMRVMKQFEEVRLRLEATCSKDANILVTKEEVTNAFGAFYHLFAPTTKANNYIRSIVEKTFEVLELGSIPPAKFLATEVSRRENRASPSAGASL